MHAILKTLLLIPLISAAQPEEPVEQPSMELLKFLAEWETDDGEWMDPFELDTPAAEQLENPDKTDEQQDASKIDHQPDLSDPDLGR